MIDQSMRHVAPADSVPTEYDYVVALKTDADDLRRENATLRARLRDKEAECMRWARRWAEDAA